MIGNRSFPPIAQCIIGILAIIPAGLGVLFVPLAILPTIQFGTSAAEDRRCGELLHQARESAGGKALPAPERGASAR